MEPEQLNPFQVSLSIWKSHHLSLGFLPINPSQTALLTLTPGPCFPPFLSVVTLWERLCSSHLPRALPLPGTGTQS